MTRIYIYISRSTPAYAGKTCSVGRVLRAFWDHPRVCGKNAAKLLICSMYWGSPPRVREKPSSLRLAFPFFRITPACAGKTRKQLLFVSYIRDHPRVCGKNNEISSASDACPGSPPRVREKL